jgi:hypothetical protein
MKQKDYCVHNQKQTRNIKKAAKDATLREQRQM